MASLAIYSNANHAPTGEELPFKPFSRNFYALIAQCENHTKSTATFINPSIAIIPLDTNRRMVVTL
ncbi:hypothetical protein ACPV4A_03710 [Vibrio rotiferianus]|uniref:hypothetical protein n=1 Tax=Vibrio rotiferianus TaxID=190895 RepID=UPI00406A3473